MCANLWSETPSSLPKFRRQCVSEIILISCADLGDQVTDWDELRFAPNQASDFLECRLFFCAKGMRIFAVLIEPRMSAAKFVTPSISRNQTKVFVEFVIDVATRRGDALQHRKSKTAMLERGIRGQIELKQRFVQITPRKQQAQPLLGNSHSVDLKFRPYLGGSAKHAVTIKNHQCRLM